MSTARQRTRSGFTLVELMVAVALALILMSVVMLVFSQALGVFRRAQATTEAIHSAQVALDFLGKDLEGAYLETEQVFLGVRADTALVWVDSNHNGPGDDPVAFDNDDPVPFDDPKKQERHGLELLSMSLFSFDEAGRPVPAVHVLYYVSWDAATQMGRLIRCTKDRDANPVTQFIGNSLKDLGLAPEDTQEIAYGIKQFRLRYFYKGVWYDLWDSTNAGDAIQYSKKPDLVEVQLRIVDSDGFMNKANSNPIVIRRLIPVGTVVP